MTPQTLQGPSTWDVEGYQAPDRVCLGDFNEAIALLMEFQWVIVGDAPQNVGPLGQSILKRVITRLYEKADAYLTDTSVPRTEGQFMAILQAVADEMRQGAKSLDWAAARLHNNHHDTHGAHSTHVAAKALRMAADSVVREE